MTPKDRFFFDTQTYRTEVNKKLLHSIPILREKLRDLPFASFIEVCQTCLDLDHYETYHNFVGIYTALDLETLPKTIRKTKEFYLESYCKTLTEALVRDSTSKVIVWFYFHTGEDCGTNTQ